MITHAALARSGPTTKEGRSTPMSFGHAFEWPLGKRVRVLELDRVGGDAECECKCEESREIEGLHVVDVVEGVKS
jgi:hypothetical protein